MYDISSAWFFFCCSHGLCYVFCLVTTICGLICLSGAGSVTSVAVQVISTESVGRWLGMEDLQFVENDCQMTNGHFWVVGGLLTHR